MIVRWPGVVQQGTISGQLVHHADLIATLAEIWSQELPENAGEDSFSLLPILKGQDISIRQFAVSCAANGTPGFRDGSWKFIPAPDPASKQPLQLYDLARDPGETRNLASEKPERVLAMQSRFDSIIENGRSTPGSRQANDVPVRRFPRPTGESPAAKKKGKTSQ